MKKLSNNIQKIVNALTDNQFHDQTVLSEQLTITDTVLRQTIKKLQDDGIEIISVKDKGYCLAEPLILLNKYIIEKEIPANIELEVLETTNSTMDYFKTDIDHNRIKVCLAETQTAGRGRFNRHWHTPFAQNINLSLQYRFAKNLDQLSGLSTMIGLSLCQSLEKQTAITSLKLKWPNDLIYADKKLGGILIEINASTDDWCNAVIGIGINVNSEQRHGQSISQAWTSLRQINQQYFDRNLLCVQLLNDLLINLSVFTKTGLNTFIQQWKPRDYLYGKTITLENFNQSVTGKAQGINQRGHLLLKLADQKIIEYSSGEVSITK